MRDIKEKTRQNQQEATLFVSNVPLDYTERDIREVLDNIRPDFEAVRINIVKKYSEEESVKSSTGSAFIVLKNKEDAQECINFLHGYRWDNLIACADFASSKE
jgi:RNA recognition motif-containing protein